MRRILLLMLLLGLAVAVSAHSAARPTARLNGTIDWISWAPGSRILFNGNGLYAIRPDGSQLQRWSVRGSSGTWSPDLSSIAVNYYDEGIAVLRLGDGLNRLTRIGNSPVWSPSGDRLAYSDFDIRVIQADGSRDHTALALRFGQNFTRENDWSADGRQLVFSACLRRVREGDECPDAVYTAELAHPRIRHRVSPGRGTCPAWERGGAIAYNAGRSVAIAAPGTRPRTAARHAFSCAEWSPDGKWLAVEGARSLIVASFNGRARRRLGSLPPVPTCCAYSRAPSPVWSPDGRLLAVARAIEGRDARLAYRIFVVRVSDGQTRLIVRTPFSG